jgi:16S rRNA (guanine966-N2)-methyltransferase
MLRIIAGTFRSRKLQQPPLSITRATKDRVREGVFSALGIGVKHARVLDLFAGSGAYGLEALSRGAAEVVLNDHHPEVTAIIRSNCQSLNVPQVHIMQLPYQDCLQSLHDAHRQFDLIFIDPPYAFSSWATLLNQIETLNLLSPNGKLVIECEDHPPTLFANLGDFKQYNYGRTMMMIGRKTT